MKESNKNQIRVGSFPPTWCAQLCRNAMNEKCIEDCAIKRDCSGFELKPGINLIDMPRFPIDQIGQMTKEEKFTSVAVYIAKTVDHLKGVSDEPSITPVRRPNHDRATSSQVPSDIQVEDLLPDLTKTISSSSSGEEREDTTVGPDEMARSTN